MNSPIVTLSMEIELAWGYHDLPFDNPSLSKEGDVERSAINEILNICDELNIPFSFDVVGHLLHEECDGSHPSPHSDSWFSNDPGTDLDSDPLYYAPDIISSIYNASTSHEICSHSYSHVLCKEVDDKTINWEFSQVSKLFNNLGINSVTSFVPPRHQVPPYQILDKHGIEVVRLPIKNYSSPSGFGKLGTFFWTLIRSHPTPDPEKVEGIHVTKCTFHPSLTVPYLHKGGKPPHPMFSLIPKNYRKRLHRRYLKKTLKRAVDSKTSIHLWTHLYEIGHEDQLSTIRWFLKLLYKYRNEDIISIHPMNELPVNLGTRDF